MEEGSQVLVASEAEAYVEAVKTFNIKDIGSPA